MPTVTTNRRRAGIPIDAPSAAVRRVGPEGAARPRGRPSKFGRPGHVVAVTLPDDTIRSLQRVDPDLGWAIVKLLDRDARARPQRSVEQADVELVSVGARRFLIVVNRAAFRSIPGVNILPLNDTRAFLALEPGRGMSDLELAAIDRLNDGGVTVRERRALNELRHQLAAWRRDQTLQIHTRAVIVVERLPRRAGSAARTGTK